MVQKSIRRKKIFSSICKKTKRILHSMCPVYIYCHKFGELKDSIAYWEMYDDQIRVLDYAFIISHQNHQFHFNTYFAQITTNRLFFFNPRRRSPLLVSSGSAALSKTNLWNQLFIWHMAYVSWLRYFTSPLLPMIVWTFRKIIF